MACYNDNVKIIVIIGKIKKDFEEKKEIKGYKNLAKDLKYFKKYKALCFGFWFSLFITGVLSFFASLVLENTITAMTVTEDFHAAIIAAITLAVIEVASMIVALIEYCFLRN